VKKAVFGVISLIFEGCVTNSDTHCCSKGLDNTVLYSSAVASFDVVCALIKKITKEAPQLAVPCCAVLPRPVIRLRH
jgi:hypothetical protein